MSATPGSDRHLSPREGRNDVAREDHSPLLGPVGLVASMMLPAAIGVTGMVVHGLDAIDWVSAIVWGVLATIVFTVFSMVGKAVGMTSMDLLDLLGSTAAEPGTNRSRLFGAIVHHANGALLAVFWAFGVALVGLPANWWTGALWGVLLTAFALLMMSTMGSLHPAIRRGEQDDPGLAATNFGLMTPMGSLMGHLVYGIVLGLGYANLPIA